METTPTKKSALKSFLVLASAVTVGIVIGGAFIAGINAMMPKDAAGAPKFKI